MRAAIVIPARLESTRLPGKLLLDRTGMPLICHTVRQAVRIRAAAAATFPTVMVAADDKRIIQAVEALGAPGVRAVMTDPGRQSGSDRIAEAASSLPADITAILNLQGDEPDFPVDGATALAAFHQDRNADISTLVYPLETEAARANPALVKAVLGTNGQALYFSRAEIPFRRDPDAAGTTYGHVGVYLYNRAALERFVTLPQGVLERTEKLEQLRALENGMTIAALVLDRQPPKGIDLPEDYDAFVASHPAQ